MIFDDENFRSNSLFNLSLSALLIVEKQFSQMHFSVSDNFLLQDGQNRGKKKSMYGVRLKIFAFLQLIFKYS